MSSDIFGAALLTKSLNQPAAVFVDYVSDHIEMRTGCIEFLLAWATM